MSTDGGCVPSVGCVSTAGVSSPSIVPGYGPLSPFPFGQPYPTPDREPGATPWILQGNALSRGFAVGSQIGGVGPVKEFVPLGLPS